MSGAVEPSAVMNFGRQLASSDKETRDKALKRVRIWLSSAPSGTFYMNHVVLLDLDCSAFNVAISESEMLKLWMGLYMTMWMADKPLIQVTVNYTQILYVIIPESCDILWLSSSSHPKVTN